MPTATETRKKTTVQRQLEARFEKPIETLLVETLNEKGTIEATAAHLGVSRFAVQNWMAAYGITTQYVAPAAA